MFSPHDYAAGCDVTYGCNLSECDDVLLVSIMSWNWGFTPLVVFIYPLMLATLEGWESDSVTKCSAY